MRIELRAAFRSPLLGKRHGPLTVRAISGLISDTHGASQLSASPNHLSQMKKSNNKYSKLNKKELVLAIMEAQMEKAGNYYMEGILDDTKLAVSPFGLHDGEEEIVGAKLAEELKNLN